MGQIKAQQVIDTAKRLLKLTQTNEFDGDFNIWLEKGYRKLYNLNTYVPCDAYFTISNGRIQKPKGYHEFIGAAVAANTPIVFRSNKYLSTTTAAVPIEVTYYDYFDSCQEVGDYIYFGSLTGDATEVHLWWLGVPVDDECNISIDEEAEEALKYFMAWKYAEENNGIDVEKKIQYYAGMFDRESGILRGHIAARDARQRKYQLTSTATGVLNFYPY